MALSRATRDKINARLKVFDGGTQDYTVSRDTLRPVLDRLRGRGWVITATGNPMTAERTVIRTVTRSPEHQARAVSLGEVVAGDDTYSFPEKQITQIRRGFPIGKNEVEPGEIIDTEVEQLTVLIDSAVHRHGRG